MTGSDVSVILVKLEHVSDMLDQVHEQVKATNGRVTELEMKNAEAEGRASAKRPFAFVATTAAGYLVVALIVWFVAHSIN